MDLFKTRSLFWRGSLRLSHLSHFSDDHLLDESQSNGDDGTSTTSNELPQAQTPTKSSTGLSQDVTRMNITASES